MFQGLLLFWLSIIIMYVITTLIVFPAHNSICVYTSSEHRIWFNQWEESYVSLDTNETTDL